MHTDVEFVNAALQKTFEQARNGFSWHALTAL
jgi:hypothetical protein